jgi:hypothetical protein
MHKIYNYLIFMFFGLIHFLFAKDFALDNHVDKPAMVKLKTIDERGIFHVYYKGAPGEWLFTVDHDPDRQVYCFYPGKLMPGARWQIKLDCDSENIITIRVDYESTLCGGFFEISRNDFKRVLSDVLSDVYGQSWCNSEDRCRFLGHLKTLNIGITTAYLNLFFTYSTALHFVVRPKDVVGDDRYLFEVTPALVVTS